MPAPAEHDPGQVLTDLAAEHRHFAQLISDLSSDDWQRPSAAPGWTIKDVVLHLAQTEQLVIDSVAGHLPAGWGAAGREPLDLLVDRSVAAERPTPAPEVAQRWRSASARALQALADCDTHARLRWAAAPLSPTTMATTRIAEHWAHAQDIAVPLGADHRDTDRLLHISWLAHRTVPYALAAAGFDPGEVCCQLTAPTDGSPWTFGPADAPNLISGPASDFCRVAARRLDPALSRLVLDGPDVHTIVRHLRTYAA